MTIRGALGGAAGDLVAMLRTRLEIFSLELAEEKSRVMFLAGVGLAAGLCLFLALLVFSLFIAALFWDTPYRLLAIGLTAAVYGVAAVVLARLLVHRLREDGVPFAVTVEELGRDAALFTSVGDAFESGGAKPDADSAENELTARSVRRPS
jgi:uncharacterized membrane protein YqjE